MPWIQLIIDTPESHISFLEDALMDLGAQAVTLQDNANQPLFEPPPGATPVWSQTRLTALFDASIHTQSLIDALRHEWANHSQDKQEGLPQWRFEALEDKDWEREWLSNFKPMPFGQRLWVLPSGFDRPSEAEICLQLDPGLAFGTGTHETTALCLEWLDAQNFDGETVLDFGCGSGILAIAAILLGAQGAVGIDNDPQALTASKANAEKNQVAKQLQLLTPEDNLSKEYNIVVANILAGPLIELSEHIAAHTAPRGLLALPGVLKEQTEQLAQAYTPWFDIKTIKHKGDWALISAVKR